MNIILSLLFFVLVHMTCDGTADFVDEATHNGWELIYHNDHRLILLVNGNNCYFPNVAEFYWSRVFSHDNVNKTMELAYRIASNDRSSKVSLSTLEDMRNIYGDLLAEFHCISKDIYQVRLHGDDLIRAGIIHSYQADSN